MNYLKFRSAFKIQHPKFNILFLGFGFLIASCHNTNVKSNQEVKAADSASKQHGDTIADRISFYTARVNRNPNDANAYWNRGKLEALGKNLGPALGDLTKAVMIDSTKAEYFFSLADIDFATGHTHEARDAFETCIRLNPKNTEAILKLAELYFYVKKYPEAIDLIDNAIKINPYLAKEYFLKGMIFMEKRDTALAISSMKTAVEQDPKYFLAYIQLGVIFASKGNPLALNYYNTAIQLQPQNSEPYYDKGLFYQFGGDYDDALKAYGEIMQVDSVYQLPDTLCKHAYYNMGDIYFENKNDYSKSLDCFNQAIKSDTNYFMAYYGRANCYEKLNQPDKALADYAHSFNLNHSFKEAAKSYKRLKSQNHK